MDKTIPPDCVMIPGYNPETGQSYAVVVRDGKKTKLKFDRGYMLIGFGAFHALRKARLENGSRLPRDAYDVLFWFLERLRVHNFVTNFTYPKIAADLEMDPSRVGKMVLALELADCVQREAGKCMRLNPNHCFFGNATAQADAIAEWNRGRMRIAEQRQAKQA